MKHTSQDTLILGLIAAGVLLYVYSDVKGGLKGVFTPKPLTQQQMSSALSNAGFNVRTYSTGTFAEIPGGVMKLGDVNRLNLAQRILVGTDRIVPGTWLSRAALT